MESKYERKTSIIKIEKVNWFRDYKKTAANTAIFIERPSGPNREVFEVEFIGDDKGCRK